MSDSLDTRLSEGLKAAADFEPDTARALALFGRRQSRRRSMQLGGAAVALFALIAFLVTTRGDIADPAGEAERQMALPDPGSPGAEESGEGGDGGGGGAAGGSGSYAGATTGEGGGAVGIVPNVTDSGDAGNAFTGSGVPGVPPSATKVIKNSRLEVRVEKGAFERQFERASALAESLGGFVSSSAVSESDGGRSAGEITMRVPSANFQTARSRIKELGKVMVEDQSGQDVTKEFVDLQARLRHARTEESFFLRLMDRSKSVGELVQVQASLSQVQLQIEQIQGQLQYLEDQTAFSTISSRIYEPGAVPNDSASDLAKAGSRSIDAFGSVVGGIVVSIGWLAPFLLIGLVVLFLRRKVRT